MIMRHENQFGYLSLSDADTGVSFLIKADKITFIGRAVDEGNKNYSYISTGSDENYEVRETFDQILEQLENIHPSLR